MESGSPEQASLTSHGASRRTPRRTPATGLFLGAAAVAAVSAYWRSPAAPGTGPGLPGMVAGAGLLSGRAHPSGGPGQAEAGAARRPRLRPVHARARSTRGVPAIVALNEGGTYESRAIDLAFALFLVPLACVARAEFHDHFDDRDGIEIGTDVVPDRRASRTSCGVRPFDASPQASMTAAVFARSPRPGRGLRGPRAVGPLPAASRAVRHLRGHGGRPPLRSGGIGPGHVRQPDRPIELPFMLCPLAFAAWTVVHGHPRPAGRRRPRRGAGRDRCSRAASVVTACAALGWWRSSTRRAASRAGSIAIILLLGLGIAARILSNQTASTMAHRREPSEALEQKEGRCARPTRRSTGVREANETLRQSEEHLRLVFDAAEDGIVELDERGGCCGRTRRSPR